VFFWRQSHRKNGFNSILDFYNRKNTYCKVGISCEITQAQINFPFNRLSFVSFAALVCFCGLSFFCICGWDGIVTFAQGNYSTLENWSGTQ